MRYADIKYPDVANGTGIRVSLFLQGCSRHCKGCFNEETWDFNGGKRFGVEEKQKILDILSNYYVTGLSILGGEPLEQKDELIYLLSEVKERFPEKDIWLWTGNKYEDIKDYELLYYVDVVVDGAFIESEKDISLKFRGSRNQRIIYVRG